MAKLNTTMDVFKLLEKTNCRKCNKPTCLAFAAAIFQGRASLSECPFIDEETLNTYEGKKEKYESKPEQSYLKRMGELKENIRQTDLASRAGILGGKFSNGRLTLKIFGKDFSVDTKGDIYTDIHVNQWIAPPVLNYILSCYNPPEEGLESDLNLFFDTTADKNLPIENIYTLTTGLANMFEKLAVTHG